ncbi:hypothetical protein [Glutamicibacter sp. M10]|uniref:hypothetical protein n=1 Tax=Glutamicibacter sp. M10 TaxID=3023076 RepID=UPI0021CA9F52|nr:hypothetical protein [Glutamicibacter sp. M10]UXN30982.1 hypothetical protein N6V40_11170 [Glutamicibacter sp. M10]
MGVFQAVWPVLDAEIPEKDLLAEAIEDLPKVARRHGVITIGKPRVDIRQGSEMPGTAGAKLVVVAESSVVDPAPIQVLDVKFARTCDRCGVEKNAVWGVDEYFCKDCKRFVKADGWLEQAS